MIDLKKIYLYRITHINNVPHILIHGITHRNSPNANPDFTPIGDQGLILTRDNFQLENGKLLGDYIPFYFGPRMPMLYVVQHGFNGLPSTPAQEIVYCVSSVQKILDINLDFIFTNGHAIDALTSQYTKDEIANLYELLDWEAIHSKFWKSDVDLDLKRRKQAELLVLGDIPPTSVLGFIVYNQQAKNQLLAKGIESSKIHINANYYF